MLKKGDSVRALPGVKDQDNDTDLGGWQGRIEDIDKDKETYVYIAWDSITLKHMPLAYIMSALDEDYEYCQMWLEDKEVEPAEPRDRPEDVEEAVFELFEKYESGPKREEEQLIRQILDSEDLSITEETQNKFYKYLQEHIKYPCIVPEPRTSLGRSRTCLVYLTTGNTRNLKRQSRLIQIGTT